ALPEPGVVLPNTLREIFEVERLAFATIDLAENIIQIDPDASAALKQYFAEPFHRKMGLGHTVCDTRPLRGTCDVGLHVGQGGRGVRRGEGGRGGSGQWSARRGPTARV